MAHSRWLFVALCLQFATGCSFYTFSVHNLIHSPADRIHDREERRQFRKLAQRRWLEIQACSPINVYSEDFADGFEDGFVDYLFAGGNGEPPGTIPWKYRTPQYDSVQGIQAIQDWIAGFRLGSQEAMASGLRDLVIRPVPLPPAPDPIEQQIPRDNIPTQQKPGKSGVLPPLDGLPSPDMSSPGMPLPGSPLPSTLGSPEEIPAPMLPFPRSQPPAESSEIPLGIHSQGEPISELPDWMVEPPPMTPERLPDTAKPSEQ